MNSLTGQLLEAYIENKLSNIEHQKMLKERFCVKDVRDFFNETTLKICGLYGLRRTGKSTIMYQLIKGLGTDNCTFINCGNRDYYTDIEKEIKNSNTKYIFIDEITKVADFINLSSSLSDLFPGKKIVIAGTDSASILFAKMNELYDRIKLIHTTYISFREYNYLLGKDIEDYIKYGGTLSDGKAIYNNDDLDEYTNTSILLNITHSIKNSKGEIPYTRLYNLFLDGSLDAAINKTLERRATDFILNVMRSNFEKSHQFGSVRQLILKHKSSEDIPDKDIDVINNFDTKEICKYISEHINLGESSDIEEKDIELITTLLKKLDVLTVIPGEEIIFTQPGMQYAFTERLTEAVIGSPDYRKLYPETQALMRLKIEQDSIGRILENIVKCDIIKSLSDDYEVGRVEYNGEGEFDLYIVNKDTRNAIVYEIKRSNNRTPQQIQYLQNSSFCENFEKLNNCSIIKKICLYQGEDFKCEDGIEYCNISDYLINLEGNICER